MKNTTLLISIIMLVAIAGGFIFITLQQTEATPNGSGLGVNGQSGQDGSAQIVLLSMKNSNYWPQEIRVSANRLVRLNLDQSVGGCYRSFTIRQLGISKYLKTTSDYVEFSAPKGTYRFSCSMGMGTGTLIAE